MKTTPSDQQITSNRNQFVQLARRLKRRRERDDSGLFLIEGLREIHEAYKAGIKFEKLLFCNELPRFPVANPTVEAIKANTEIQCMSCMKGIFEKITYVENSEGLLVIARQPSKTNPTNLDADGCYLVVDAIEKPGNLGAMFRSADAVGCDGLLICNEVADLMNPNVIRASLGTVFSTMHHQYDAEELRNLLMRCDIRVISTSPHAEKSYTEVELGSNCAIVIGSEKSGLSSEWINVSTEVVRLPTEGTGDSINAAMAATVMLFEAHRQRHATVAPATF